MFATDFALLGLPTMQKLSLGLVTSLLLLGAACSDSLVEICEEAQAANCTTVRGSCSDFVDALERIALASDCQAELGGYQDCATEQDACSVESACGGEQTDFALCIAPYCASNVGACTAIADQF